MSDPAVPADPPVEIMEVVVRRRAIVTFEAQPNGRCRHCGTSREKCLNLERERCCPPCSDPWHAALSTSSEQDDR